MSGGSSIVVHDDGEDIVTIEDPATFIVEVITAGPQGPRGPQGLPGSGGGGSGGGTEVIAEAASTILAGRAVALDSSGLAYHPNRSVAADADRTIGVAATAALTGEDVLIVTHGPLTVGSAWMQGPLYVGTSGALTSTVPTSLWHLRIAVALSSTDLFVDLQPPINLT